MKYRKLDVNGDYPFGGSGEFFTNDPAGVSQAIKTRLLLMTHEWFLDANEGTPYDPSIIGYGTAATRDPAVIDRILGTPGVKEMISYSSSVDRLRVFRVNALVDTIYGVVPIDTAIGPVPPPPPPAPPPPPPAPPPPVPIPTEGVFALFHFTNTEFHSAEAATDQTGATWVSTGPEWLLPAADPAPKFGSGYITEVPGSPSGVLWFRDSVQNAPVFSHFNRPDNNPLSLDAWGYAATGTAFGNSNIEVQSGGEGNSTIMKIMLDGGTGDYVFEAGGITVVSIPLVYDTWVHLRICYDGTNVYSFVDGELIDTQALDLSAAPTINGMTIILNNPFETDLTALDEAYVHVGVCLSTTDFVPPTEEWPNP